MKFRVVIEYTKEFVAATTDGAEANARAICKTVNNRLRGTSAKIRRVEAVEGRLFYINPVRKRLADGTVKTYYYAWLGKDAPRLDGEPGTLEFIASYERAMADRDLVVPPVNFWHDEPGRKRTPKHLQLRTAERKSARPVANETRTREAQTVKPTLQTGPSALARIMEFL